eukprot:gene9151-10736_t
MNYITPPSLAIDNFSVFKSIVITPTPSSTYIASGIKYYVMETGKYTVAIEDYYGCTTTDTYNMFSAGLVFSAQPKCVYSVVNATFPAPDMYQNSSFAVDSTPYRSLPLEVGTVFSTVSAVRAADGEDCQFITGLVPQTKSIPSLTINHAKYDGSVNGSLLVGKAASYSSISFTFVLPDRSHRPIKMSSTNGLFSSLTVGNYILRLDSASCGIEVVNIQIIAIEPEVDISISTQSECVDDNKNQKVDISIAGLTNPEFNIVGQTNPLTSPVMLTPGRGYQLNYINGTTNMMRRFTLPRPAADITHTISVMPTCASPSTVVTVNSPHLSKIVIGDGTQTLVDGKFTATYGKEYVLTDTCTSAIYKINIPRVAPQYLITTTNDSCSAVWRLQIINADQFSSMSIQSVSNGSFIATSTSGDFTDLNPAQYIIRTTEKNCANSLPELVTIIEDSPLYFDVDYEQLTFDFKVIKPNQCTKPGLMDITVYYKKLFFQSFSLNYTASNYIYFPKVGSCTAINTNFPVEHIYNPTPSISIVNPPTCAYSLDGLLQVTEADFPLVSITINGKAFSKSADDTYPIMAGDNTIHVLMNSCPYPYTSQLKVTPTNSFKLDYKITPQQASDCSVKSGSIQVLNPANIFSSITLGNVASETLTWQQLASGNQVLEFESETCSGQLNIDVPTTPITITTTSLTQNTCNFDAAYLLVATNGTYNYDVAVEIINNDDYNNVQFTASSNIFSNIVRDRAVNSSIKSGRCAWTYSFVPAAPVNLDDIFTIEFVKFPSCPDVNDGVFRLVNTLDLDITIDSLATSWTSVALTGNAPNEYVGFGYGVNQDEIEITFTVNWNSKCSYDYDYRWNLFDIAPKFDRPAYTVVQPDCGSSIGKIIFDAASIAAYDINVDGYLLPNAQGEVALIAADNGHVVNYFNRASKCKSSLDVMTLFDVPLATTANIVNQYQTCVGSPDGYISLPSANATSVFHLTVPVILGADVARLKPEEVYHLAPSKGNTYSPLTPATYVATQTDPTNPYCFKKQAINLQLATPTITVSNAFDLCTSDQVVTITVTYTDASFTDYSYILDNGTPQISNKFTNVQPGHHTIRMLVNDYQCNRYIYGPSFHIANNVITSSVQQSTCDSVTIKATSANSTALLLVAVDNSRLFVFNSTVTSTTLTGLTDGSHTIKIVDGSGCSVKKEIKVSCELSSASSTTVSMFLVISFIALLVLDLRKGTTKVIFGNDFNQPLVAGLLPTTVISLRFGERYNQPLQPGLLHEGLKKLKFGHDFNQHIKHGDIPSTLIKLNLGFDYNKPFVPGLLPEGLKILTFYGLFDQKLNPGDLPNGIEYVRFGLRFNQHLEPGSLPLGLKKISFSESFNQRLIAGSLPIGLDTLIFSPHFNQPLEPGHIPNTLTNLTFGTSYNQPLVKGALPIGLTTLTFGYSFDLPLRSGHLPNGLKSLTFGMKHNQPIRYGTLPKTLEYLRFGEGYKQAITYGDLPDSLTSLVLEHSYPHRVPLDNLPESLQQLTFVVRNAFPPKRLYPYGLLGTSTKFVSKSDRAVEFIIQDNRCWTTLRLMNVQFQHVPRVLGALISWHPSTDGFDPVTSLVAEDIAILQSWGLNAVRFGAMWPGVEPERGVFNQTYLYVIKGILDELGNAGIYTIIDFHQDLINRRFCGEGIPDWAVVVPDTLTSHFQLMGSKSIHWITPPFTQTSIVNLLPMYKAVNEAIRQIDDKRSIILWRNRRNTRHTSLCNGIDNMMWNESMSNMKHLGGGGFMTEFGAVGNVTNAYEMLEAMANDADRYLQSWAYWQFKYHNDLTTSGSSESFYLADELSTLSRSRLFLVPMPKPQLPTIIYLNEALYYSNGYTATIVQGDAFITSPSTNILNVVPSSTTFNGSTVTIHIVKK